MKTPTFFFTVLYACSSTFAAPGDLDSTFGTGGKVSTFFGISPRLSDLAVLGDGRMIAAGNTFSTLTNTDFGLIRYLPNGSVDSTFGVNGMVATNLEGSSIQTNTNDYVSGIVIQNDGKIVVGGYRTTSQNTTDFALARYLPNGSLDAAFGSGGIVITPVGTPTILAGASSCKATARSSLSASPKPALQDMTWLWCAILPAGASIRALVTLAKC